jgi:hypothetical protein
MTIESVVRALTLPVIFHSEGTFINPQNGDTVVCSDLEAVGLNGGIDATTCALIPVFILVPCGCAPA